MSGDWTFKGLSHNFLKVVRTQASKTVLKICCKCSSVYLRIKGPMTEKFGLERPAGRLDNLLSKPSDRDESDKDTKRRFLQGHAQSQTKFFLEQPKILLSKQAG